MAGPCSTIVFINSHNFFRITRQFRIVKSKYTALFAAFTSFSSQLIYCFRRELLQRSSFPEVWAVICRHSLYGYCLNRTTGEKSHLSTTCSLKNDLQCRKKTTQRNVRKGSESTGQEVWSSRPAFLLLVVCRYFIWAMKFPMVSAA